MRLLSLDIDFFVTPAARSISLSDERRLPASRHKTASIKDVRRFLEVRCKLSDKAAVPGVFMRHHGQAFDVIDCLARHDAVDLVHVDAHADLGLGWGKAGSSWRYILGDWVHRPFPRPTPHGQVDSGNWLAFAAAGELVRSVEFVPTDKPTDLFRYYFRREESLSPYGHHALEFFSLTASDLTGTFDFKWPEIVDGRTPAVTVPFHTVAPEEFQLTQAPDFVLVCQSPQFTPKSADKILSLIRKYVREVDLGLSLTPPL